MASDTTIYRDGRELQVSRRAYERVYRPMGWSDMPAAPNASARKPEWVDFAVAHGGMQRDDAERLTRDELVERFAETSPSTDGDDQGDEPENQEG